jgi:hypothetical protein
LLAPNGRRLDQTKGGAMRSPRRRIRPAPYDPVAPSSEGNRAGIGQWFPDPTGRGDRRYWDGRSWTDQISRRGTQATDSISDGYARPEQFRFHEENALHTKLLETASRTVW